MTDRTTQDVLYDRARTAHPDYAVDKERFTAFLASRLPGTTPELRLEDLAVADMYLALACAAGDAAALGTFEADIVALVPRFLRHLQLPFSSVDEIKQRLRTRLLVAGADGAPPRILAYRGQGPLSSWVRVSAVRIGLDMMRTREDGPLREDDAGLTSASDLELEHLRRRYSQGFETAIREAAATLTPRQRALLRLQHVDGLNGEQIGALYGVNRSTVSRWVATAHDALLDGVRRALMTGEGLSPSDFTSLTRLIHSQLHISVRSLLAASEPVPT